MSRWSEAEDKYILEFIQEVQDDINYSELVESHNKSFNTKRTEDTYKVRVRKIAKDNDIILKSNNHWTEEEKDYVLNIIQRNPFEINMNEMTQKLKRSEASIKKMYNDLVSPEDHMNCCILNLDGEDLIKLLKEIKHICTKCNKNIYSVQCVWSGLEYCDECHYELFNNLIIERWKSVREYSVRNNKSQCNICMKQASFDNSQQSRFHYDHLDMFDKVDSICKMVRNGTELVDIYQEINKCQLLCVSCHTIVTKVEILCGFNRVKRQLTKDYNDTNDETVKETLMKKYSKLYSEFMSGVYKQIREVI
jgi:hypothetical protein